MPVETVGSVNARTLSRNTSAVLRAVADDGQSLAIEHCGRVVGFLIPLGGRVPVGRGRRTVYEVPEPEPLLELNDVEAAVVTTLYRLGGKAVADQLVEVHSPRDAIVALAKLEVTGPPLLVKTWSGYELTDAGERHAKALGG